MSDIFNTLLAETDNEYAVIVDDGVAAGDVSGYIGTGNYAMNALLSGSIYGGLPQNKVTAFAGEPSVGKTFYALNVVKQFLEDNKDGFVFYFESESAISKQFISDRGIDAKRVAIVPVATVQEFRTQAVKVLDKYLEGKEKPPIVFVLDSLGNLSTDKEMQDIADGKDTRDMTRAQLVRGAFRVLTLKLGKAKVPLIVTNHVYDVVGSFNTPMVEVRSRMMTNKAVTIFKPPTNNIIDTTRAMLKSNKSIHSNMALNRCLMLRTSQSEGVASYALKAISSRSSKELTLSSS